MLRGRVYMGASCRVDCLSISEISGIVSVKGGKACPPEEVKSLGRATARINELMFRPRVSFPGTVEISGRWGVSREFGGGKLLLLDPNPAETLGSLNNS